MIYEDKFKPEEIQAFKQLQQELKLPSRIIDYIIAYIGYESNFNALTKHRISHVNFAYGFLCYTRRLLKSFYITPRALGSMTPVEQILFLIRYLKPYKHKLIEIDNVVGLLIDPAFVEGTKPETNVYNSKLQFRYFKSRGHLQFNEILSKVTEIYHQGKEDERLRNNGTD